MRARTSTVYAPPTTVDAGITHVRDELMPALADLDGHLGLSLLVDRGSGQCVLTTSWSGAAELRAAEPRLRPLLDRSGSVFGGRPVHEDWTIALRHREPGAPAAACVRATWLRIQPGQAEHVVEAYRLTLLPQIREFDGFCSASLLIDPATGYAVSSVGFAGHDAMRRTHTLAAAVRERGAREVSAEIIEVGEFELTLAHLRVPELA